jgi:hypothetical protein
VLFIYFLSFIATHTGHTTQKKPPSSTSEITQTHTHTHTPEAHTQQRPHIDQSNRWLEVNVQSKFTTLPYYTTVVVKGLLPYKYFLLGIHAKNYHLIFIPTQQYRVITFTALPVSCLSPCPPLLTIYYLLTA